MSLVQLQDGRFGCILKDKTTFIELKYDQGSQQSVNGCWYHRWYIDNMTVDQAAAIKCIKHYCVLLPLLLPTGMPTETDPSPTYTILTSEWMAMQQNNDRMDNIYN
jgi:hypothetical protein